MGNFMKKHVPKISKLVASGVICLGFLAFGMNSVSIESYAADHWSRPYLNNLISQGVMRGDSDGGLYPDRPVTRAEFVAMMNRAFGYTEKGVAKFKDVPTSAWYYDDIRIASQVGYFQGSGKSKANPEEALKREEAVTMLCRALKIEGIDQDNFTFKDSISFSNWSKDYINASVEKDFLNGYPDGTFKPNSYMKRGEMAKVLSGVAGYIVNRQGDNSVGSTNGNVSLIKSGARLLNTTIPGDLYITAGADLGSTKLENVTVKGDVIVSGTGESQEGDDSIIFSNCDINNLVVDSLKGKMISLKAEDNTSISKTIVKSSAFLQEDASNRNTAFKNVVLNGNKGTKLNLAGDFNDVRILGEGNSLVLSKGYAERITVDEKAVGATVLLDENTGVGDVFLDIATKITGNGKIDAVIINTDGTSISMMPKNVTIRPGITANVNGKVMTSLDAEINARKPEFVSGYPKKEEVTPNSADILLKVNKPGKIYWVVREAGTGSRLYAEDLIKPKKETAFQSGNLGAMADKEATLKLAGLSSGVEYEFVAVFADLLDKNSYEETVRFTTVDNVAPKFITGYPKVKSSDTTSITLSVNASKNCDYWWVLLPEKSVSPTVDMVINQNVTGAVKKGIATGGVQNVEKDITITDLEEYKNYDFYIVAKDSSNNKSNLVNLAVATADKTAPLFKFGPVQGTATNNSVMVKYEVNEAGSLYWVAVKKGDIFPKPIAPATTPPALGSKEAADAVITGNNVDLKAKVSMTANTQTTFNVSNLEKERDYDLYIVLEDNFKNASNITKISIKPSDTTPPTATLEFPDHINGKPLAKSNIIMNFNEIVCDSDLGSTLTDIAKSNPTSLAKNITLYDMSKNRPEPLTIDFSKAQVKEVEGKTSIVFGTDAITLTSGNVYEFELNKLKDTSGNRMSDKTKLTQFSTVPPLVDFVAETSDGKDIAFLIDPQEKNTSDIILYDTVLISSENIKFKLYSKEKGATTSAALGEFSLDKGRAYTIRYLIDKQKGTSPDYKFDKFKDLADTIYEMEITQINENSDRKSWSETVNITAKGIIGDRITMNNAVNAIASGGISRLKDFTTNGSIFTVEYPTDFTRTAIFTDTEVPAFASNEYPRFLKGETKIGIEAQTTKPAKMYYVAAKLDGSGSNPATATPTSIQMEKGMTGQGIKSGSLDIPYGYYLAHGVIEGLDPTPAKYRIYYMLKGTMPEASQIKSADVEMDSIKKPLWESMPIYDPGQDSVKISYKLNTDADVYWVVYQKDAMFAGNSPTPSAMEIIEPTDDSTRILAGHDKVSAKGGIMEEILCKGLELKQQYKFFAVAKKELGNTTSDVAGISHMVPLDLEPPQAHLDAYIITDIVTGSAITYKGNVMVTFSEPVFYRDNTTGEPKAFTRDAITNNPSMIHSPAGTISVSHVSEMTVKDSITAIKSIEISFNNFQEGAYITFPILGDARNIVGELIVTLKKDESDPKNPKMVFVTNWK